MKSRLSKEQPLPCKNLMPPQVFLCFSEFEVGSCPVMPKLLQTPGSICPCLACASAPEVSRHMGGLECRNHGRSFHGSKKPAEK